MLGVFRTRAWCLVTALFLAVGTTTAALDELLHAGAAHDPACALTAEASHDASRHRYQAASSDRHDEGHCIACHFARAPRIGSASVSTGAHADETRAPLPSPSIGSALAAARADLPPRSPPLFS